MIKTIDVNALEWLDKINGNSYFSGTITINFGMEDERTYKMPFKYGYSDQFLTEAREVLYKNNEINTIDRPLSYYCREHNIILRQSKKENCLKRELKNI